jgi:hypothetical protein
MGIGNAQGKKADDCQHVNEIHHEPTLPRLDSLLVKTAVFFSPRDGSFTSGVASL